MWPFWPPLGAKAVWVHLDHISADQESLAHCAEADQTASRDLWKRASEFLEFRKMNHLNTFTAPSLTPVPDHRLPCAAERDTSLHHNSIET